MYRKVERLMCPSHAPLTPPFRQNPVLLSIVHSPKSPVNWPNALRSPAHGYTAIRGLNPEGKKAQFSPRLPYPSPENPAKPSVSARMKKKAIYRFVCQNTAEMHLVKCTPKAIKSRLFLPLSLPHPDPGKAAGMRI